MSSFCRGSCGFEDIVTCNYPNQQEFMHSLVICWIDVFGCSLDIKCNVKNGPRIAFCKGLAVMEYSCWKFIAKNDSRKPKDREKYID